MTKPQFIFFLLAAVFTVWVYNHVAPGDKVTFTSNGVEVVKP